LDELFDVIAVPSLQKLEWNCKGEELNIWNHILQFRPSGLRVKRLAHVPALVAMTTTQIPIVPRLNTEESLTGAAVGTKGRHLLPSEALQLQGFPPHWRLPKSRERAFTCFGNAVHAGLVKDVFLDWLFSGHFSAKP
jgi:DNA (cytosine-5)-methyltransferase 1